MPHIISTHYEVLLEQRNLISIKNDVTGSTVDMLMTWTQDCVLGGDQ